jgi:RNA polymerase sigma-70 factor (ECF subfamily)
MPVRPAFPEVESDADAATDEARAAEIEMLYHNQRHALVRVFTRNRASPDDARDLVQETFLRFAGLDRDARISRPVAYLHMIARNLLRDRAKAAYRHSEHLHDSIDDHTIMDADEMKRLEARDSLARIEAAMRSMKPKTREIFMAHRVHGLSYAEIAAESGLSVKGVEKQMSKAIAQLERLMDRR